MGAGASVEFGDEMSGGGEHDRVESCRPVGGPGVERVFGGSGEVTNMHATMLQVELQRLRAPLAERERSRPFGGVGEAMQLGESKGAVCVCDVAEHAAGADRG